ncbi:MAG TPA: hypothetical protein VFJ58_23435 [Armatimonadota bacterium]|nr:hypothetical protein [Armatimonadota bacterium]
MRTTIDIPDDLLRRAKATAALRGMKLKELIASCLEAGLSHGFQPVTPSPRQGRSSPPLIPEAMTGKPIRALTNEEIAAIELEEDVEKHIRSLRR